MATDEYDWHWTANIARGSVPPERAQKASGEHRPHWLAFLAWLREHGYYADDLAPGDTTVPPGRPAAPEPPPPMTAGDDGTGFNYLP